MSDDPSNPTAIEIPLQIELPNGQTLFAAVALGGLPFDGQRQIAERIAAAWNAFTGVPTEEIKAPVKCLHQIAEPSVNLASELADMLERSITGLGHYRNTERWSEADEEHINECNALLERFNSSDDEHEVAPQAVQAAVPMFWVRLCRDGLYEGPVHNNSASGKLQRDAKPEEWHPLYLHIAPTHPAEGAPAQTFKTKVFQALGIGSACDEHVVFVNIENLRRRADCLSAIEREFFMVETPPDESEGDLEPGEECLLNWAHSPEQYVNQFAEALAATQPTEAARSVLAERARQIAAEGWTPEKDDAYNPGVLAEAGGIYALHALDPLRAKEVPEGWPWSPGWWKPKDPRTNLVKAGALILAEIERIDRSYAAQQPKEPA